jgi:hypothetical protein
MSFCPLASMFGLTTRLILPMDVLGAIAPREFLVSLARTAPRPTRPQPSRLISGFLSQRPPP